MKFQISNDVKILFIGYNKHNQKHDRYIREVSRNMRIILTRNVMLL